jgi:hypothetical protein
MFLKELVPGMLFSDKLRPRGLVLILSTTQDRIIFLWNFKVHEWRLNVHYDGHWTVYECGFEMHSRRET